MMNKFLLILSVCLVAGCNNNDESSKRKIVKNKKSSSRSQEKYIKEDVFYINYPEDLREYSEAEVKIKYPGNNRPKTVYGNDDFSVTIGVSLNVEAVSEDEIPMFMTSVKNGLIQNVEVEWLSDEIENIDNHTFGVVRFFSNSPQGKIYNLLSGISHNNKLVMITFNCLESQLDEWEDEFEDALESIYFE